MADAFVPVDDNRLPPQHGENIALGTDQGAGRTTDAIRRVNMGMLRLRAVRAQFSLLLGFEGASHYLLLLIQVSAHEK